MGSFLQSGLGSLPNANEELPRRRRRRSIAPPQKRRRAKAAATPEVVAARSALDACARHLRHRPPARRRRCCPRASARAKSPVMLDFLKQSAPQSQSGDATTSGEAAATPAGPRTGRAAYFDMTMPPPRPDARAGSASSSYRWRRIEIGGGGRLWLSLGGVVPKTAENFVDADRCMHGREEHRRI